MHFLKFILLIFSWMHLLFHDMYHHGLFFSTSTQRRMSWFRALLICTNSLDLDMWTSKLNRNGAFAVSTSMSWRSPLRSAILIIKDHLIIICLGLFVYLDGKKQQCEFFIELILIFHSMTSKLSVLFCIYFQTNILLTMTCSSKCRCIKGRISFLILSNISEKKW